MRKETVNRTNKRDRKRKRYGDGKQKCKKRENRNILEDVTKKKRKEKNTEKKRWKEK